MILDRLTLENFCLYQGRQMLDLGPVRRNGRPAPIVLIGGRNGGGKTTLLDAVALALYGARAACSKRSGKAYEQFLKACIHRRANPGRGASVTLRFR